MNAWWISACRIGLFYAVSVSGYALFRRIRVPTPAILGPIVFIGVLQVAGAPVEVPSALKACLSIATGTMLGLRFNWRASSLVKELLLVTSWLAGLSFLTARVLRWFGLDAPTALFAAMPGGIGEISLMSTDFHADTFMVAVLQMTRLLSTMVIFPLLVRRIGANADAAQSYDDRASQSTACLTDWLAICLLTVSSYLLLQTLSIPAGNIIGLMVAVGFYVKRRGLHIRIRRNVQLFVQIGIGGIVGLSVTKESVLSLGSCLLPALTLDFFIVGGSLLLAYFLQKVSGWDWITCLLSCSPAGLSPTVLLAMEMGADSGKVAVFQMLRMALALVLAPIGAYCFL